jgi:hypothetical protein
MMRAFLKKVAAVLLGLVVSTACTAGTVWMPTDKDVNVLDFFVVFPLLTDGDFYLLDDNDSANLAGATKLQLADGDLISFQQDGADWTVTGSNGSFTLSGSDNFIFAELNNSVFAMETGSSSTGPNQWVLNFGSGAILQATDVAPVPLPPAVLLFGSAMVGLAAIGRRRVRARSASPV